MTLSPKETYNDTAETNDVSGAQLASTSVPTTPPSQDLSWGQKYGAQAYSFSRNILGNYVVNFAISALGAYAVVKSPIQKKVFTPAISWFVKKGAKAGIDPVFSELTGDFLTRTQLLLFGGHSLLPFMKWTHDHKERLQFNMGHDLDLLQELAGKGNTVSKQNIEDYHRISSLLSEAKHNRKELNPVAITLNDGDKALLAKYNISEDVQFNENRRSWKHVIKARSLGIAATTTLSIVFSLGSFLGKKKDLPWIDVKETYLKKGGGRFGEKYLGGLKKVGIKDTGFLGELVVLELIYTLASKLGFDHIEKRQLKDEQVAERARIQAQLAADVAHEKQDELRVSQDKNLLSEASGTTSRLEASPSVQARAMPEPAGVRRKILDKGEQDFRTRGTAAVENAGMAIS